MVVTMHKMTSAHGVKYLLKSVAVGDGDRRLDSPMTRYYTDAGTPPGRWLGTGVAVLGHEQEPRLHDGDGVTEEALRLLLGEGLDPITGLQLGRTAAQYVEPPRHRARDAHQATRGRRWRGSTSRSLRRSPSAHFGQWRMRGRSR